MNENRWKQRFSSFQKAFKRFEDLILLINIKINNSELISEIEKEATIQRFEFTHELAWKVMKDFLEFEGFQNIIGSRSATREAFNKGLISNGEEWMNMIETRNKTVHTYNEEILNEEFVSIISVYYPLFKNFSNKMNEFL